MTDGEQLVQVQAEPEGFVEELADEQDYWMSLTDAARVTRTSEAMARRWVSSGRLPVKKEPAGINQRTRLVRASDVARIRPIIDHTAAITDDIHKLDLLSIPRQQERIVQEHQSLASTLQTLHEMIQQQQASTHTAIELLTTQCTQQAEVWGQQLLATQRDLQAHYDQLATHVQDQAQTAEQFRQTITTQQEQVQLATTVHYQQSMQTLDALRTSTDERFTTLQTFQQEERVRMEHQLATLDQHYQNAAEALRTTFTAMMYQQQAYVSQELTRVGQALSLVEQAQRQQNEELATVQAALPALITLLEARLQEAKATLQAPLATLTQTHANTNEHLTILDRQQQQLASQMTAFSHTCLTRIANQDQRIQELSTMLEREANARIQLPSATAEPTSNP